MMQIIQLLIVLFALFALSRTILRFKDKRIKFSELSFWTALWSLVIVLSIVPEIIDPFVYYMGISRPMDFASYLSIILLFYLVFRLYIKQETISQEITKLTRELAFLTASKNRRK